MNKVQKKMVKDAGLKKDILENGWAILNQNGREALRMRELAKLSDCSVGTVYNLYDNLNEIILRLNVRSLDQMYGVLHQEMRKEIECGSNLYEVFHKMGKAYISFGLRYSKLWRSLFESVPIDPMPEWYKEKAQNGLFIIEAAIQKKFGLSEGQANQLVNFFWAAMHGMTSILINRKLEALNESATEAFVTSYIDHCLRGFIQ
jgi:AcrR family transcriptional regulator